jgi:nucleotide-binding universal stress UspA family protein
MSSTIESKIVVGMDGSAASVAALRWALERAAGEHRTVTAIEVRPAMRLMPGTSFAPAPYGVTPPPERLRSRLHETVAAVRDTLPGAPEVTEVRLHGDTGVELARAAHNAAMLVLGHNPHGRTTEFLFGHVTAQCLRHAGVPVVLVPAAR